MDLTEGNFLVTIGSLSRYFETFEGGDKGAGGEKRRNGGQLIPRIVMGRASYDDITLSTTFEDSDEDDIELLEELVGDGSHDESITVRPCNMRNEPIGRGATWTGHVSKVVRPKVDNNSDTPASWSVVLMVTDRA